ncbi:MAG: SAM-dependent methyltransferase [Clostridia bacterium]|nr:SAM-dependent methyltransferase [Clostridia bacterium]
MLDARLLCAANLVRDGARLADIGTDHAYLPVYLMQSGRISRAIAADIGEGPAASARQHIKEADLTEQIEVRVCDGLTGIAEGEATDIVIAGMGGETMIHILSDAPWVCTDGVRLVLQPMTKTVELRAWLFDHGFAITEEHLIPDGRHRYVVMAATYTGASPDTSALAPYIGALDLDEGWDYFVRQEAALQKRVSGLERAGHTDEAAAVRPVLEALRQYMNSKKENGV